MESFDYKVLSTGSGSLGPNKATVLDSFVSGSTAVFLVIPEDLSSRLRVLRLPITVTGSLETGKTASFSSNGVVTVD